MICARPLPGAVLALVSFLSCLALPVPASVVMLAAGALASAGDLALAPVALGALAGAVPGDQAGIFWGAWRRRGEPRRGARTAARPRPGSDGAQAVPRPALRRLQVRD